MEEMAGIKKIKEVRALCERSSARKKSGLFVAEGERLVAEIPASDIGAVYMSLSYREAHPGERCDHILKDADFARLADTMHPQGVLATVKQRKYTLPEVLGGNIYIILETIQDPGNLGTIIRTAEAAGVSAVIMNKGCADIYSPKVVRSTMGSIFRVPFIYTDDLAGTISEIKRDGVTVYAASLSGSDMYDVQLDKRRAFIIGNEGSGITEEIMEIADHRISIPMSGKVESLNAAVSAAVLIFRR